MPFLAFFVSLPGKNPAGRMRVWRALRAAGAVTLRDGVYLLPEAPAHAETFGRLALEARRLDGSAECYRLDGNDEAQRRELLARFDRGADYAALIEAIARADAGDAKTLRGLRRDFRALAAIDFFPGEARRQAEAALAAREAEASGEPTDGAAEVRRLALADFQRRLWATRRHLWIDRLASAWLIRRHIDANARFVWLDDPARCPADALGFDFDGATFTHAGGRVSFEVLAASFGLDADPAIARLGAIVHHLDVGGVAVAEAAGIEAVLAGARATLADDDALLTEASRLFDHLYQRFAEESPDD